MRDAARPGWPPSGGRMEGPLKTDAGPVLHRVPATDHRMAADPAEYGESVKLGERLGNLNFSI